MKALKIILTIIAIPVIMFEYLVFLWYWSGDGTFTLISVPIVFAIIIALHAMFIKLVQKAYLKLMLTLSSIFLSPVFTVFIVFFIADIFGIVIEIA